VKPSHRAWTLAALAGLGLLAGCTSVASMSTTSVSTAPASSGSAGGSTSPGTAPATGRSPSGLVAAAVAALKAGPTVHVGISTTVTSGTITFSDDATASGGRQDIALSSGGQVSIIYVGGVGYVKGNAQGLAGFMGVAAAQAQTLAGRWIAVRPGQELGQNSYRDIVDGITLSSVASEIALAAPLSLTSPATVAGQQAIGVQGGVPASQQLPSSARAILDVAAAGSRPLRWTASATGGYQSTISFSDWGESLKLTAPAGAIPAPSPQQTPILAVYLGG
jgi:hypothetical protein